MKASELSTICIRFGAVFAFCRGDMKSLFVQIASMVSPSPEYSFTLGESLICWAVIIVPGLSVWLLAPLLCTLAYRRADPVLTLGDSRRVHAIVNRFSAAWLFLSAVLFLTWELGSRYVRVFDAQSVVALALHLLPAAGLLIHSNSVIRRLEEGSAT